MVVSVSPLIVLRNNLVTDETIDQDFNIEEFQWEIFPLKMYWQYYLFCITQYLWYAVNLSFTKESCLNFASNPLSFNPTKWTNTPKQFVGNLPTNCLGVFDHFVGLALKRLILSEFKRVNHQRTYCFLMIVGEIELK